MLCIDSTHLTLALSGVQREGEVGIGSRGAVCVHLWFQSEQRACGASWGYLLSAGR